MKFNCFLGLSASKIESSSLICLVTRHLIAPFSFGVAIITGVGVPGLQSYAAAVTLGNGGVRFEQDTTLESEFVESHGAYQSTFGVVNLDTNEKTPLLIEDKASDRSETVFRPSSKQGDVDSLKDFVGLPGKSVTKTSAKYTFKAKANYVFYLESTYNGRPTGVVYSSDVLNPDREQQVQFSGNATELCQSGMILNWDDTGSKLVRNRKQQDRDFDDFVVRVRETACPIGGGDEQPPAIASNPPLGGGSAVQVKGGSNRAWLLALPLLGLAFLHSNKQTPNDVPNKAVPEPITILGSAGALGWASLMHRRKKKSRKKK